MGLLTLSVLAYGIANWVNFTVRTVSPDADSMVAMIFWLLTDVFAALAGWEFQRHKKKSQT